MPSKSKNTAGRRHRKKNPELYVWRAILARCYSESASNWEWYGGKGITVCDQWRGETGFVNFLADMGERPSRKHELDRHPDKMGNYEPTNCRWVEHKTNCRNRTTNLLLTHNGLTMTLVEWAEKLRTSRDAIKSRLRRGLSVADALTGPFLHYRRERKPRKDKGRARYNARILESEGRSQTLAEWAAETGVPRETIQWRLRLGWTETKALTTPRRV